MSANRLEFHGDSTFRAHFGPVCAVTPMRHVMGNGHTEKVAVCFTGGVSLELSQAVAIELARRLPEAINALPQMPDCAGEVWRGENV